MSTLHLWSLTWSWSSSETLGFSPEGGDDCMGLFQDWGR